MSALAYAEKTSFPAVDAAPARAGVVRSGFWRRVLDAMIESRRIEAERMVEAYLIRSRRPRSNGAETDAEAWRGPARALPF